MVKSATPGPKNSINLPTTPFYVALELLVMLSQWQLMQGNELVKRTPITSGIGKYDG